MKTLFAIIIVSVWIVLGCQTSQKEEKQADSDLKENQRYDLSLQEKLNVFEGLTSPVETKSNPLTPSKIALGKLLYFDNRLSAQGNINCNSCHNLKTFGVDNLPVSPGDKGENGARNSPTVFNAVFHKFQFWDGRAKDLEEQAGMPILNPVEMAIPNKEFLVKRLSAVPKYNRLFAQAFPESQQAITYENITQAIAAFERKLVTKSRFEAYLSGDQSALTLQEKKGLSSFINLGCTNCHNGAALGGNTFKKFGEKHEYPEFTNSTSIDKGLAEVTKDEAHLYMFKVPSLMNVEKTAPYFHDGSVGTLDKAIQIMAKTQLDIDLTPGETENILAFLKTLTGNIPIEYQELTETLP